MRKLTIGAERIHTAATSPLVRRYFDSLGRELQAAATLASTPRLPITAIRNRVKLRLRGCGTRRVIDGRALRFRRPIGKIRLDLIIDMASPVHDLAMSYDLGDRDTTMVRVSPLSWLGVASLTGWRVADERRLEEALTDLCAADTFAFNEISKLLA
jgi:hypothetical protein